MFGKLVPCGGGIPIPLLRTSLVLGRRPECDITIPCATVSGRHCLLEFNEGFWWVRDLQSKNGTAVNGQRGVQLKINPKGVLSVGRQRMFVEYKPQGNSGNKITARDSDDDLAFEFLNAEAANDARPDASLKPTSDQKANSAPGATDSQPASPVFDAQPSLRKPAAAPAPPKDVTSPPTPVAVPQKPVAVRPQSDHARPKPSIEAASAAVNPSESPKFVSPVGIDLGKLIPCGGGVPIPLPAEELILGRGPDCDIRIRFPSVSSRHCKLRMHEGYWMVEDLHSTNGTWVDGDRCLLQCLMPDSVLALDKHRFTISYLPRSDGPPPAIRRLFSQSLLEKAGLANDFAGNRLGTMQLPDDDQDRPKRYNLSEFDDQ